MKILVKLPSRERPAQLKKALRSYMVNEHNPANVDYIVSIDDDDRLMENLRPYEQDVVYKSAPRVNKIEAINRDIDGHKDWDILCIASDDMICVSPNWDRLISNEMITHFPDTDGCLWFNDGRQQRICTFVIMGRKYYERFGYAYHPSYKSLWCDNEQTEVALSLNKIKIYDKVLFEHQHPAHNPNGNWDELYRVNEALFGEDKSNYERRKKLNFPK